MTKSRRLFVALQFGLLLGLAAAGLGYLGSIYHSEAPNNEREGLLAGQTAEIAVDIGQNPAQSELWRITAYCPCVKCCGKWSDGITASGAKAQGKLIAAPSEIPFGTWIDIPGYGMAEVLDRGGSIKGRRLDLLFPSHQEALNWGVKYLEIKL